MKKVVLLLMLALWVMGCQQEEPPPTAVPPIEEVADVPEEEPTETAVPEPEVEEPEPTEVPTEVPTEIPTVEPTATAEPMPAYTPVYTELASCPFDLDAPEGVTVRCGEVTVPENRQNLESGREVVLPIAIFGREDVEPAADPVVYLEGGPGGYALDTLAFSFEDLVVPFLDTREFIVFDQRGAGYAEPDLTCTEIRELTFELLDDQPNPEVQNAQFLEATAVCRDRLAGQGIDLSAYNSAENAADVNDIRLALGYDEWNLYGISYGTRLGQTVLRDYPAGVRTAVLDSVYPLDVDLLRDLPDNLDRAFDIFFEACEADAACNSNYPNLKSRFFALVDQLNETPAEFEITYISPNSNGIENYDVVYDGNGLIGLLFQTLYSNQIFPAMPQLITEAEAGNYDSLGFLYGALLANGEFFSTGMYRSVQCREELAFSDESEIEAASVAYEEYLTYFDDWEVDLEGCDIWDVGTADARENEPVVSDVPTLLLTGTFDPITPPAWGARVGETFSADFYFEVPEVGHGASTSAECAMGMVQDFLADPTAEPASDCLADIEPVLFAGTEATTIPELVSFESELFGTAVSGLTPDGWEEVLPGTFARGATGLDQTVLIYQALPAAPELQVIALFKDQLNLDELAETGQHEDENGRVWSLYRGSLQGYPVDMTVTNNDGVTLFVLMITEATDQEAFYEAIYLPALSAFQVDG